MKIMMSDEINGNDDYDVDDKDKILRHILSADRVDKLFRSAIYLYSS